MDDLRQIVVRETGKSTATPFFQQPNPDFSGFRERGKAIFARRFDGVLRPHGLTNGQFSILMSLNRPEPPPMGPVASLLSMDRTTPTAALKPLERRGLVQITPNRPAAETAF